MIQGLASLLQTDHIKGQQQISSFQRLENTQSFTRGLDHQQV